MWLYYSLLSSVFNAFGILARKTHGSLAHPLELCWWSIMLGMPLSFGLLLTSHEAFYTSYGFVWPLIITSISSVLSSSLSFYAYQHGDTSAIAPLSNLLPVFMIVTSFIILGVLPSWGGLAGILLVVIGVYYSSVGRKKLSHPLTQIMHNRGSLAMLGCVALWAISNPFDRLALESASPAFLMVTRQLICFVAISLILLLHPQKHRFRRGQKVMRRWGWHILAIAVFSTLAIFFQLHAVNLIDPTYVLAVKRLDIVFTVLLAHFLFKEKHVLQRFEGSIIAFVGVLLMCVTLV